MIIDHGCLKWKAIGHIIIKATTYYDLFMNLTLLSHFSHFLDINVSDRWKKLALMCCFQKLLVKKFKILSNLKQFKAI